MKKLASGFILCLMLAGSGMVAHADSTNVDLKDAEPVKIEDNIESANQQASIELIKPEPDYMVTTNSTVVISGKGISGTSVLLEVYGQEEKVIIEIKDKDGVDSKPLESGKDGGEKSEGQDKVSSSKSESNGDKKPKTKKFTKRLKKETFEIGSMGLFAKEVKLNVGENKIILKSKTDGTRIERIVKYKKIEEGDMKKSMDKIQGKGMTELINDICSQK
ncbi:hypothetical protein SAMN02745945_02425 [Peptoclostridium litorale DSM 5388]|uniref:Uncharacterized protein n=1 Tax=Peptoclostridium litorale DSM 5388 TaxID=1121324 RepID=A0A069RH30_PEPLI|nr:hypothetical protein [Peptoclostridium litorale]KDR96344.1 hypothetical protein CLIT_4c01810 [Peptoclostridium litorale DSM 5388]SIO26706.1 hypothetical protein SAMN02745945_02425 [Peptoclostridium litorale DSM 5388]